MTARFKLALAGLLALVLGTGLTWLFMSDGKPSRGDDDLAISDSDAVGEDDGEDGRVLLRGEEVKDDPRKSDAGPGGTNASLVGARDPSGDDWSDPAFRAKRLADLLGAQVIDWKQVSALLRIMDEPLSETSKRVLIDSIRVGPRGLVLGALSVVRDGALAEDLLTLVDEEGTSELVKQTALLALGRMPGGDDDEIARMLEQRLSGRFRADVNLLAAIAERGGSEGARAIVDYLTRNVGENVRPMAFKRFDLSKDEAAREVFDAALRKSNPPEVTKHLLALAAAPEASGLVDAIVKLESGDASTDVREAALRTLGRIGSTSAVEHLLTRARESGQMGQAALRSLDSIKSADVEARAALRKELGRAGLSSRPTESKTRLLGALGRLKDKESLPAMVAALDDPEQKVERAAIIAIGRLGRHAEPAFKRLVDVYETANTGTRMSVVHAMGSMGGPKALETLDKWAKAEGLAVELQRRLKQARLTVKHRLDAQGP